jgi:lactocepin
VSEENASFASFGGVLYSKEGKTLFVYPPALGVGASYEVKEGTQFIANGAFCKSGIKSISLPEGLLEIGENAFRYSKITSVVIPDSVTRISKGAFLYSTNLTDVKLGEGVEYIGEYAFRDTDISSVLIPASVSFIGKCAFCGCSNLSMILVSEENPEYKSIDGNLYTKDGKVFLQYSLGSEAESFIITDGVREISEYAFFEADNLKSLTLPESVVKIGKSAFVSSSLESLVIPCKDGWVAKVDLDGEGENIDPQDLSSPEKCVENLVKSKWNIRHLERKTG